MKRIARVPAEAQVSARVVSITRNTRRADTSRQVDRDHASFAGGKAPLAPPYPVEHLDSVYSRSNMLRQCVAAIVTNVASTGWDVVPAREGVAMDPVEKEELESFVYRANSQQSLASVHEMQVEDYERRGFSFIEVIRDRKQRISLVRHLSSSTARLCPKHPDRVPVTYDIARGPRVSTVTEYRTFRIFVQTEGGKSTYFKEFGDPRKLDYVTGEFESPSYKVPPDREATEVIHFRQHSDDPYGEPRWIGQLPSILGSREVEEVNLRYFEDNTVPPMILSVAGGRLTAASYRELKAMLSAQGVGRERQNQILLVEAVAERESLEDKGSVQLKVDKLTDSRPSDGLFSQYDEGNQAKVRSSFRLPPSALGLSQDTTFATAQVSMFIAETQVYQPQRARFDELYNTTIVQGLGLKTVALKSRPPAITSPEMMIKSLTALNVMGAVTPRMANELAAKTLQIPLPPYPAKGAEGYEAWMDEPIVFVTRGVNSDAGQEIKDDKLKELEKEGDVALSGPENGQQ